MTPQLPQIMIYPTLPELLGQAQTLSNQLHLPITLDPLTTCRFVLRLTPSGLALKDQSDNSKPLSVDFLKGKLAYRRQHTSKRQELLVRALGLKKTLPLKIVDATAGLGRDSFILAGLGWDICLLERSPINWALLQDGIQRGLHHAAIAPIMLRMNLIHTDAISWLRHCPIEAAPDIIYLDPMFPPRTKSALGQKEMRILHDLLGPDLDTNCLLQAALACAKKRVVVKRPRHATALAEIKPNYSMLGSSSRFDIYWI